MSIPRYPVTTHVKCLATRGCNSISFRLRLSAVCGMPEINVECTKCGQLNLGFTLDPGDSWSLEAGADVLADALNKSADRHEFFSKGF